jgi:AsmA family protein
MNTTSRPEKFGKTWIFLVIAASIAVAILLFDWNWLRGPLSGYLSQRFGREVSIQGDFHVDLSAKPRLVAEAVVVGNAPWSAKQAMVRAERVSVRVDPASLWHPPVALTEVTLVRPRVLLEHNADGRANWEFDGELDPPRIDGLTIEDGVVHYLNPVTSTDVVVNVVSSPSNGSGETPVQFSGSGRLRDSPFTIEGTGASLLALENGDRPYWLDVRARAGNTSAHFDGTVVPKRMDNVEGLLSLQGRDLSQLYPIIPVPIPWTPAYRLSGRLEHRSAVWYFPGGSAAAIGGRRWWQGCRLRRAHTGSEAERRDA